MAPGHLCRAGLLALMGCTAVSAQKPNGNDYLAWFRAFDATARGSLIRSLERKIQLDPNPAIQRIVSLQRDTSKLPLQPALAYHRAAEFAPKVAPIRRVIPTTDPRHRERRKAYPPRRVLPELIRAVFYDWGTGQIVRRKQPLSDVEVMTNLLNGYPPGSDITFALLLEKFDTDSKMRKVASYLAHRYANLDGSVFAGITLYEAWYSGEFVAVPDVDSIPFARTILRVRSFRSPIPANAKRTALYAKIRDAAFVYRKYRTLREAAAAAFLRAEPKMDPNYVELVPRLHYLLVTLGDDPDKIRAFLKNMTDRDKMIAAIDKQLEGSSVEYDKRLQRKQRLVDMQAWVSYWAKLAIYERRNANGGK